MQRTAEKQQNIKPTTTKLSESAHPFNLFMMAANTTWWGMCHFTPSCASTGASSALPLNFFFHNLWEIQIPLGSLLIILSPLKIGFKDSNNVSHCYSRYSPYCNLVAKGPFTPYITSTNDTPSKISFNVIQFVSATGKNFSWSLRLRAVVSNKQPNVAVE